MPLGRTSVHNSSLARDIREALVASRLEQRMPMASLHHGPVEMRQTGCQRFDVCSRRTISRTESGVSVRVGMIWWSRQSGEGFCPGIASESHGVLFQNLQNHSHRCLKNHPGASCSITRLSSTDLFKKVFTSPAVADEVCFGT